MKNLLTLCLLLCSFAVFAQKRPFESKEHNFKIVFPGEPKATSSDINIALGKVTIYTYMYKVEERGYVAMVTTYPDTIVAQLKGKTDEALKGALNGALQNTGSKLEYEKDIEFGQHKAKEFMMVSGNGKMLFTGRLYFIGGKLYMIQAIQPSTDSDHTKIMDFLNSFALTGE